MMNSETTYRTHRVGTVTTGSCMIVFGVLLLLHSLFDMIAYEVIFALWPLVLIGLGMELLLSNFFIKHIVYDKGSIVLLVIMTFFAIGMAVVDVCIRIMEMQMI